MPKVIEQIVRLTIDGDETKSEIVGELIRCKDCKWYDGVCCLDPYEGNPLPEAYCSAAEVKK